MRFDYAGGRPWLCESRVQRRSHYPPMAGKYISEQRSHGIMRQLREGPDGKTNNLGRGLLGSAAAGTVRTATGNPGRADDRRGATAIASLRPQQPGP